jgi:hypothetical protein
MAFLAEHAIGLALKPTTATVFPERDDFLGFIARELLRSADKDFQFLV